MTQEIQDVRLRLRQTQGVDLALSVSAIGKLERHWDDKVENDPYAFIPSELRGKISPEEAYIENMRFGSFASSSFGKVLRESNTTDRERRYQEGKKLVAVGAGRGYDSNWIEEAVLYAGLGVFWVDVSERACEYARRSVDEQFKRLVSARSISFLDMLTPKVVKAEIRTALLDPDRFELPRPDSVEVWYLARTLGCLSVRSAKICLQLMGESLAVQNDAAKESCIFVVSALREDNPLRVAHSSRLYTLKMMKTNVAIGARRPVQANIIEHHDYFGQKYSAVLISAK